MTTRMQRWLQRDPDSETRLELEALIASGDETELTRRFAGRLEFGTAGLRGVVGAGPAMMNRLVIRETSTGLGNYLLSQVEDAASKGIVVAYDGRVDSRQFAEDAACTFAALGFTVFLTPDVAATPIGAFGVLHLGAAAGVVVTASHNPPEYNGYKVYWGNGAQIVPPHDAGIAAAIELAAENELPWVDFDRARQAEAKPGRIEILSPDFYRTYANTILNSPLFSTTKGSSDVSIAYTAMHGVGADMAESLLNSAGFDRFFSVTSQREPDGRFPTVNFPNPEEPGAMDAVLALARAQQTTLACANDPDADRLAVAVRESDGNYQLLSGDAVGILLADYLLSKEHSFIPIVCTTIVSSSMLGAVAAAAGALYRETLTGFKWLANVALALEDEHHKFLFAYEEALGYAPGGQVRDKDGLSALLAFAQMTAELERRGSSVQEHLKTLFREHGIFLTDQRSLALDRGAVPIGELLRASPPERIGGQLVMQIDDLKAGTRYNVDGTMELLEFPSSDVLIFRLESGARIIVRPSGTEPKVKCYYEVRESVGDEEFRVGMLRAEVALAGLVVEHQNSLAALIEAANP